MIFCVSKKSIIIGVSIVLVVALAITGFALTDTAGVFFGVSPRKLPVYKVDRGEEKVVALTFDAAWGADKTRSIMDTLKSHDAKATFFLVGFWIDKFPEEVKLINDNGYEIGNHSHNHLKMSSIGVESIRKELAYVSDNVKKLTGKECKVFRPPFGDYNDRLVEEVKNYGMMPIQWDVDSLDWKGISGDEITKRVCSRVTPGSIVLFHNNSEHILDALPNVLTDLKSKGYKFVTVSDLIYTEGYTIDNNGVQHKNN